MAISLLNYQSEHVGRRAFVRDWAPNLFWPVVISLLAAALAVKVGKPAILASVALAAGVIGLRFHVYQGDGYYARLITALTAPRNADPTHHSGPRCQLQLDLHAGLILRRYGLDDLPHSIHGHRRRTGAQQRHNCQLYGSGVTASANYDHHHTNNHYTAEAGGATGDGYTEVRSALACTFIGDSTGERDG